LESYLANSSKPPSRRKAREASGEGEGEGRGRGGGGEGEGRGRGKGEGRGGYLKLRPNRVEHIVQLLRSLNCLRQIFQNHRVGGRQGKLLVELPPLEVVVELPLGEEEDEGGDQVEDHEVEGKDGVVGGEASREEPGDGSI
jgi:hypothetical protein